MPRHRLPLIFAAALVTVAISGCVAPVPAPTAIPTTTPTATPEPAVAEGPTPRIDATCKDIVDPAALRAFLGSSDPALAEVDPAVQLTPDDAAREQLGALTCFWGNGLAVDPFVGSGSTGKEVRLSILPEGLDQAIAYVDGYQIADPTYGEHVQGPRCIGAADDFNRGYCELFGVIGQTWIELTVDGIEVAEDTTNEDLVAGFRALIDPMVARVAVMTPHERWVPDAASAIVPAECDALAPTDVIVAATGVPGLRVGPQWDGPRIGQYWYATTEIGAARCSLALSDTDASLGQIGILPSGSWAFDRFAAAWRADGGVALDVAGVPDGAVIARCADAEIECRIDASVAGNWVRVMVYPTPSSDIDDAQPAEYYEAARAAAEEIVAIVVERVAAG